MILAVIIIVVILLLILVVAILYKKKNNKDYGNNLINHLYNYNNWTNPSTSQTYVLKPTADNNINISYYAKIGMYTGFVHLLGKWNAIDQNSILVSNWILLDGSIEDAKLPSSAWNIIMVSQSNLTISDSSSMITLNVR